MVKHGTANAYNRHGCRCAECLAAVREYNRAWRERNRDKHNARSKAWRENNIDKANASAAASRAKNKDAARERGRKWHEANKEKANARSKQWHHDNKERVRAYQHEYRTTRDKEAARIRNVRYNNDRRSRLREAFVESVDPQAVYARDNWICHICSQQVDSTLRHPNLMRASLDHVVPISKGGKHSYENCACSHVLCNSTKGNKVHTESRG